MWMGGGIDHRRHAVGSVLTGADIDVRRLPLPRMRPAAQADGAKLWRRSTLHEHLTPEPAAAVTQLAPVAAQASVHGAVTRADDGSCSCEHTNAPGD